MRTHSRGPGRCDLIARRLFELALCVGLSSCSAPRSHHRSAGGSGTASHGVSSAGAGSAPAEHSAAGEAAIEPAPPAVSWCEAQPIIADKCGRCHGDAPDHGAPFALASYADTQSVDARDRPRHERMLSAIETDYMPATFLKLEPAVEPLSEAERELLLEWLTADAPRGDGCPETP